MVFLKQVEDAYLKSKLRDNTTIEYGKKAFKLTRDVVGKSDDYHVTYELYHYGTWIITIKFDFTHNLIDIQLGHGYSASDRNNINSLLQCLNIYFTNTSILSGCLLLNYKGKRTKQLIVKMGYERI